MKWNHKLLAIHSPRLAPRLMIIITIIKIVRSERKNYDISEGSVREKLMEMQKMNERKKQRTTKQKQKRNKDTEMSMLIFTIPCYIFYFVLCMSVDCGDSTSAYEPIRRITYYLTGCYFFFVLSTPSLVLLRLLLCACEMNQI